MAPIIAAMTLGGPAVGGWVAVIGSTEMRELRGRIPWYGTLANHAGIIIPAIVGGIVRLAIVSFVAGSGSRGIAPILDFVAVMCAAVVFSC